MARGTSCCRTTRCARRWRSGEGSTRTRESEGPGTEGERGQGNGRPGVSTISHVPTISTSRSSQATRGRRSPRQSRRTDDTFRFIRCRARSRRALSLTRACASSAASARVRPRRACSARAGLLAAPRPAGLLARPDPRAPLRAAGAAPGSSAGARQNATICWQQSGLAPSARPRRPGQCGQSATLPRSSGSR